MKHGPQARTRVLHAARDALETALTDARAACHDGVHDGLTEAFDLFIQRVHQVAVSIAGPRQSQTQSRSR